MDEHGIGPRSDRRDASHRGHAYRAWPVPAFSQAREREPLGFDQGPPGAHHDRGGGNRRAPQARRHHRRGHRRQYRPRTCPGWRPQRLSHAPCRPRQDGAREGAACQGHGRRGRHHAFGRGQGASGLLPGPRRGDHAAHRGRLLRQPVRQPRQSSGARGSDRARKSCARWMATSTQSWSASARAAR